MSSSKWYRRGYVIGQVTFFVLLGIAVVLLSNMVLTADLSDIPLKFWAALVISGLGIIWFLYQAWKADQ